MTFFDGLAASGTTTAACGANLHFLYRPRKIFPLFSPDLNERAVTLLPSIAECEIELPKKTRSQVQPSCVFRTALVEPPQIAWPERASY